MDQMGSGVAILPTAPIRHRLGLGEISDIVKVAIGPKWEVHITVAVADRCSRKDSHPAAHLIHNVTAPFFEEFAVHSLHYAGAVGT